MAAQSTSDPVPWFSGPPNEFYSVVTIALWALEDRQVSPSLELVVDKVLQGGIGRIATDNPSYSALRATPL